MNELQRRMHDELVAYVAKEHPGSRVIGDYVSAMTLIEFEDASGLRFFQKPSNVTNQGLWIPGTRKVKCNPSKGPNMGVLKRTDDAEFQRQSLQEMDDIARSRGGRLVPGQTYVNSYTKLLFEDKSGVQFFMRPNHIRRGSWSPREARKDRDPVFQMAEIQAIVEARGGQIVEGQEYRGAATKLRCIDKMGAEFKVTPGHLKTGQWSPHEHGSAGEKICRQALEHMFGVKFEATLDVIKRPNGARLEIDCYNPELAIGIEFQGYRHKLNPDQKIRDAEKHVACASKGILLVEVDQFDQKQMNDPVYVMGHVADAIRSACEKSGRSLPALRMEGFVPDFGTIARFVRKGTDIAGIAERRGGYLIDGEVYEGAMVNMQFVDASGNQFGIWPYCVRRGEWSRTEGPGAGATRISSEGVIRIVTARGDKLAYDTDGKCSKRFEFKEHCNRHIREHETADGLTKRVWTWKGDVPEVALYGRPTIADEYRLTDGTGKNIGHKLIRRLQRADAGIPDTPPVDLIDIGGFLEGIDAMLDRFDRKLPGASPWRSRPG